MNSLNVKLFNVPVDYYMIFILGIYSLITRARFNKYLWPLYLFTLYLISTGLWSSDIKSSMAYSIRFLFIILLYLYISKSNLSAKSMAKCVLYITLLQCLLSSMHILANTTEFYGRFYFTTFGERGDPNFTAYEIVLAIMACYYLDGKNRNITLVFLHLFLFITVSRSVLAIYLFLMFIHSYTAKNLMGRSTYNKFLFMSAFFVVSIFISVLAYFEELRDVIRYESLLSGSGRFQVYEILISSIQHIGFTGLGAGQFRNLFVLTSSNGTPMHLATHNVFLETWFGSGLIGLVLLLLIIYLFYKKFSQYSGFIPDKAYSLYFMIVTFSFYMFFVLNIETHRYFWIVFMLAIMGKYNFKYERYN